MMTDETFLGFTVHSAFVDIFPNILAKYTVPCLGPGFRGAQLQ